MGGEGGMSVFGAMILIGFVSLMPTMGGGGGSYHYHTITPSPPVHSSATPQSVNSSCVSALNTTSNGTAVNGTIGRIVCSTTTTTTPTVTTTNATTKTTTSTTMAMDMNTTVSHARKRTKGEEAVFVLECALIGGAAVAGFFIACVCLKRCFCKKGSPAYTPLADKLDDGDTTTKMIPDTKGSDAFPEPISLETFDREDVQSIPGSEHNAEKPEQPADHEFVVITFSD